MSLPVWPAALPARPLREGWQETSADGVDRDASEVGPGLSRPRALLDWRRIEARYKLSAAQRAVWRGFWAETVERGARPFIWPHPWDGDLEVQLMGDPVLVPRALGHELRVTLQVLP